MAGKSHLQPGVPAVGHPAGEHPSRRVLHRVEPFQRAARVRDQRLAHLGNVQKVITNQTIKTSTSL